MNEIIEEQFQVVWEILSSYRSVSCSVQVSLSLHRQRAFRSIEQSENPH